MQRVPYVRPGCAVGNVVSPLRRKVMVARTGSLLGCPKRMVVSRTFQSRRLGTTLRGGRDCRHLQPTRAPPAQHQATVADVNLDSGEHMRFDAPR